MLRADDLRLHVQSDEISAFVYSVFYTLRRLCWEGHRGLGQGQLGDSSPTACSFSVHGTHCT